MAWKGAPREIKFCNFIRFLRIISMVWVPSQKLKKMFQTILENKKKKYFLPGGPPSRPFKTRSREFYVTLFAITGLVGLILFIAEGAMPVVLLIAIVFLFYILSTVAPE